MRRYDHFHAEVETKEGIVDVEGGWTGAPDWGDWDRLQQEFWLLQTVCSWGGIKNAIKLKTIHLGG